MVRVIGQGRGVKENTEAGKRNWVGGEVRWEEKNFRGMGLGCGREKRC